MAITQSNTATRVRHTFFTSKFEASKHPRTFLGFAVSGFATVIRLFCHTQSSAKEAADQDSDLRPSGPPSHALEARWDYAQDNTEVGSLGRIS